MKSKEKRKRRRGRRAYRKLAFEYYPLSCNRCAWEDFTPVLQVHHIDHDRQNNDLFNLEILCPNCHMTEHYPNWQ